MSANGWNGSLPLALACATRILVDRRSRQPGRRLPTASRDFRWFRITADLLQHAVKSDLGNLE